MISIENWVLIKLLGGFATLTAIIVGIVAKVIVNKVNQFDKQKHDKELEHIKAEVNKNNSLLLSLSQNYFTNTPKVQEVVVEAYLNIWKETYRLRREIPTGISTVLMLLMDEELNDSNRFNSIKRNPNIGGLIDKIDRHKDTDFLIHSDIIDIDHYKPFISDKAYLLFYVYRAFVGRTVINFIHEYQSEKLYNWKNDQNSYKNLLKLILNEKEINELYQIQVGSFNTVVELIQTKIKAEIREQLNIITRTEDSIQNIKRVSDLLNKSGISTPTV